MATNLTMITDFGTYSFDAVLETQGKLSVTLPSYPTESGVRINDHRILQPNEFKIKGISTTMPLGFSSIDSFISRLSALTSVRPTTFLEALGYVMINSRPFTVVSRYQTYRNMTISEIIPIHTAEQDGSVTIDLKLQEFMTVDKLLATGEPIVEILNVDDPSRSAISANVKTGEIPTNESSKYFKDLADKALNLS